MSGVHIALERMESRAKAYRTEALAVDDPDSQRAASLRGKARGLAEAALMLRAGLVLDGDE